MVAVISKLAKEIKHNGADLITRPIGRKMYAKIRDKMKDISNHEVMVLDFEGIRVIDSSFIDEMIVRLIIDSWKSDTVFYVKLKNISNIAEINIDSVFKSFSHYNKSDIAVITEGICQNNSFFIGPLTKIERDIIEYLRINKNSTAREIGAFIGKTDVELLSLAEKLFKKRLVRFFDERIYSV